MDVTVLSKGDIVTGEVIRIEDGQAIVDVGYKYEGVIPINELSAVRVDQVSDIVSVGDRVECKVIRIMDEEGKLILSRKEAGQEKAWDQLEQIYQSGKIMEVKVADVVKGGLVADVGVRAFIPASLVEKHFVEDFSGYKGKTLRVKIVELNRDERKVVLSQKAVLQEEEKQAHQEVLKQIRVGEIRTGKVQRITPFGVFVDVGGVDGLVHISEVAWNRVEDASTVVAVGDEVRVKVLKVDLEQGKVSLSIKQATEGPWQAASKQFKAGDIVNGTVRRLAPFGAFVEVAPGVEGLVHISQLSSQHVAHPKDVVEVGQEVQVKVLEFNPEAERMSLSMREVEHDQSRREMKQYDDKNQSQGTGATLGDLFGDLLKQVNTKQ